MDITTPATNTIQAKFIAVPAIPENPSIPAINAIIKNVIAQLNIEFSY